MADGASSRRRDTGVNWDSPTWGHNPVHESSDGSWVPDRHEED